MSDDPADFEYELVMPFVTVTSKGGPHDEDAYVCGWECGTLDATLAALALAGADSHSRTVHTENLPQLELIAMKHGCRIDKPEPDPDAVVEGWTWVRFEWDR